MLDEQTQEEKKRPSRAASIIKWALIIVIGLPVAWFTFCEARKTYWDWRVTQLCEKDGGVVIRIPIEVTADQYAAISKLSDRYIGIPSKALVTPNDLLFAEDVDESVRNKNPKVVKRLRVVKRKSDETIIGTITSYSRIGGDVLADHPSYFSCPAYETIYAEQSGFVVKGDKK